MNDRASVSAYITSGQEQLLILLVLALIFPIKSCFSSKEQLVSLFILFSVGAGRYLNFYSDQNMCLRFGMSTDGYKDQCINPEGFASFLGLLESIPISNIGSNNGSNQHSTPDLRYS